MWDKEIPSVFLGRVLALNSKEWWIIVFGVLGCTLIGSLFPVFSVVFGEILRVFSLGANEVTSAIHPWAGLYIVLGLVSGIGVFLKVIYYSYADI